MNLSLLYLLSALLFAAPEADKAGEAAGGIVTRPIPRTRVSVKPFTAAGYQYWEPERGRLAASLVRSGLAETGRFTVLDSLAWALDDSLSRTQGVIIRDRYEIQGEILKLGTRHRLVVSALGPADGGLGEVARTWREDVGNLERLDRAVRRIVRRMAGEFPLRRKVVRVEGNEVDVELGTVDGVGEGDLLTVYRRLDEVRHPETGAALEWRLIPLGKIRIVWVGRLLSRARIEEENYVGGIQPGDRIE